MPREPSGSFRQTSRGAGQERRRFARVFFTPPLPGRFGRANVEVLDLNLLGVTVAHYDHLAVGEEGVLRILQPGAGVTLPCSVKRSQVSGLKHILTGKTAYRTVLVFPALGEEARQALEGLMVREIEKSS